MLQVRPTGTRAVAARWFACTTLSTKVKSREISPSPWMTGVVPARAAVTNFGITAEYSEFGILAGTEHVEVPEDNGLDAVQFAQGVHVVLRGQLADSVRRQRRGPQALAGRQLRLPSVHGGGPGKHDPSDARSCGREHHLDRTVHICLVRRHGGDERTSDRWDRRLVEDHLDPCRGSVEGGGIEDACGDDGDLVAERLEPGNGDRSRSRRLP